MTNEVAVLPPSVVARGLDVAQWNTLCNSLFPGAKPDSVLLAVDYCKARNLDVMKKPCHIVPIQVKQGNDYVTRDVVMPGIYELRTTAMRTQEYLGHSPIEYGEIIEYKGLQVPEWASMVVFRWNDRAGRPIEFPIRVLFSEVVNTNRDGKPTQRWLKAPVQMMDKCLEAAGLRKAFPDEVGGQQIDDEMHERIIDAEVLDRTTRTGAAGHGSADAMAGGTGGDVSGRQRRKPAVAEPTRSDRGEPAAAEQSGAGPHQTDSGGSAGDDAGYDSITAAQATLLRKRLKDGGISEAAFCVAFAIANVELLSFEKVEEAKDWIAGGGK
jgi:phage recombination protein Bet